MDYLEAKYDGGVRMGTGDCFYNGAGGFGANVDAESLVQKASLQNNGEEFVAGTLQAGSPGLDVGSAGRLDLDNGVFFGGNVGISQVGNPTQHVPFQNNGGVLITDALGALHERSPSLNVGSAGCIDDGAVVIDVAGVCQGGGLYFDNGSGTLSQNIEGELLQLDVDVSGEVVSVVSVDNYVATVRSLEDPNTGCYSNEDPLFDSEYFVPVDGVSGDSALVGLAFPEHFSTTSVVADRSYSVTSGLLSDVGWRYPGLDFKECVAVATAESVDNPLLFIQGSSGDLHTICHVRGWRHKVIDRRFRQLSFKGFETW